MQGREVENVPAGAIDPSALWLTDSPVSAAAPCRVASMNPCGASPSMSGHAAGSSTKVAAKSSSAPQRRGSLALATVPCSTSSSA